MSESRVVLPHPDGPTMETNSHGPICMEMFLSALTCISSPRPYSRETESSRSPTAWPRRSENSSAGGASVSGRRTAGSSSTAGSGPLPARIWGAGATRGVVGGAAITATAVARASRSSMPASGDASTGGLSVSAESEARRPLGTAARLLWRRLPPEPPPPRSSTDVATRKESKYGITAPAARNRPGAWLRTGAVGDLIGEPLEVSGHAVVDGNLEDLRQLIGVVLADVLLNCLGARLDGLHQAGRLAL